MAYRGPPRLYRPGLGFIGPALSLVSFARSLNGPEDGCPEVRNSDGDTRSIPWSEEIGPTFGGINSWYNAAEENLDRAESWPSLGNIPGGASKVAELRALWEALPSRAMVMSEFDSRPGVQKAVNLAQAALCIIHTANELEQEKKRPKPKPVPPVIEDPPGWWERFKDWFDFPDMPGGEWKFPELPDLPELPKMPKIEPWMIAAGLAALVLIGGIALRQSPQARAVRRIRK